MLTPLPWFRSRWLGVGPGGQRTQTVGRRQVGKEGAVPLASRGPAACFSCAVSAAPPAVTWIHAVGHTGIRGGSLGWLWANPPFLPGVRTSSCSTCIPQGVQTHRIFPPPHFPIQRSVTFGPRGDGISAVGKANPLGFSRIKWSCLELSLPQEKAERVLNESWKRINIPADI